MRDSYFDAYLARISLVIYRQCAFRISSKYSTRATLSSQQDCISLALRAPCEASCPNFEPRAHARLAGLTTRDRAWPSGRFAIASWLNHVLTHLSHVAISPNQVLTHAARAAAKQLKKPFQAFLAWPRAARAKGSGQSKLRPKYVSFLGRFAFGKTPRGPRAKGSGQSKSRLATFLCNCRA